MEETGSRLCEVAGFAISGIEFLGYVTSLLLQ
jgi:hypothetical protein